MQTFTQSCIRCGKDRISGNSWQEQIGKSMVTYTMHVCPDSACQKIVEEKLLDKKIHIDTIQANSLKRREETRRNRRAHKQIH